MDFVDRIYVNDWPLILLNKWIEQLILENDSIRPEVCQAIDRNYTINQIITRTRFREMLFERMYCGGKLCKNICDGACATGGNIVRIAALRRYLNFDPLKPAILAHFFIKLNDSISHCYLRYRIGILALYLNNENENEFIRKEKCLILNQLSNRFYLTDYMLVDADNIFTHIKYFIDSVVIIVDAHYQNEILDDYYKVLKKFKFLKIFLVKTEDIANIPNTTIKMFFNEKLPENEIVVYNWLSEQSEDFTKNVKKHLPMKLRIKVAFFSWFVKKKIKF